MPLLVVLQYHTSVGKRRRAEEPAQVGDSALLLCTPL